MTSSNNFMQAIPGSERCVNGHKAVRTDIVPWQCSETDCEYSQSNTPEKKGTSFPAILNIPSVTIASNTTPAEIFSISDAGLGKIKTVAISIHGEDANGAEVSQTIKYDEALQQLDAYYADLYDKRFRAALGDHWETPARRTEPSNRQVGYNNAIDQAAAAWEKMRGEQ